LIIHTNLGIQSQNYLRGKLHKWCLIKMGKRILIISGDNPNDGEIGGKHTHIRLLEKGLLKKGINYQSIYPDKKLSNTTLFEYAKNFLFFGSRAVQNPHIRHFLKVYSSLREKIREIKDNPAIIHCQDVLSLYAAHGFFDENIPRILTLHGYYAQEAVDYTHSSNEKNLSQLYQYAMEIERNAINQASRIIAVDTRIKNYILENFEYDENRIIVLTNSTDSDEFIPIHRNEMVSLRNKRGYGNDEIIILVPRRLVSKNGVEYAIRAVKSIINPRIRLLIIGDGPLMDELKILAEGDFRIIFYGAIPHFEVHEFFKLSDIILIPSITSNNVQEATSLSMLEGMACGKIVICSDIGGMKEVIKNCVTGYLVEEKRDDLIADIIQKSIISENTIQEIGQNARKYILENHSYLSHTEKHLSIYKQILERNE